ncbi:hypothetical protein M0R04_15840 [Candidatus Dojkabacteria bacterium]|jgi:hypothetical protein|nr:hypothetical protein [Candidatus Dojkabacteria bacterium]
MKVKLLDLLTSKPVLQMIGESKEYDGVTTYKIGRNIDVINPELIRFEKSQKDLFEKYSETVVDESGEETKKIPDEKLNDANKDLEEITESEVELDIMYINPEKFGGLSAVEMMAIDFMLKLE